MIVDAKEEDGDDEGSDKVRSYKQPTSASQL